MAVPLPNDKMINAGDTVTMCIGGQMFVTRRATLFRLPDSRLYMIAAKDKDNLESLKSNGDGKPIYFFDRDPEIFRFVLDYYRTGELHLPSGICGPFVRKELIFWGIDESFILPCCMPAYMRYEEERRTKKTLFKDCFEDIDSFRNLVKCSRGMKRYRFMMWLFFDHPSSSLAAKIWAMTLLLLMIASIMCYCLSTHDSFRLQSNRTLSFDNNSSICTPDRIMNNPKVRKDCTSEPIPSLVIVDIGLNILFSLEFLLKVLLAPDKKKFLQNVISILDIVILSSYWMYISFYYYYYYNDRELDPDEQRTALTLWVLNILSMSQALRILRIFKISKISRGLRVLILTVKKSIPELVLLGFLLMNGMFLFSSLIYMAEYYISDTFKDIPEAFWWSIVTLTTVGYGDIYPKGGPGYFIGSITAISGCILTGLAIPIIGNNFNTYYKYMQNQLKEDKYIKQLHKDLSNSISSTKEIKGMPSTNRKYMQIRSEFKSDMSDKYRSINGINRNKKSSASTSNIIRSTNPFKLSSVRSTPSTTIRGSPKLTIPKAKSSSILSNNNQESTSSTLPSNEITSSMPQSASPNVRFFDISDACPPATIVEMNTGGDTSSDQSNAGDKSPILNRQNARLLTVTIPSPPSQSLKAPVSTAHYQMLQKRREDYV